MNKRNIAILGSTGSIGTQTLEVIKSHPDLFKADVLTAANNYKLLIDQALEFKPQAVVISNPEHYSTVKEALANENVQVYAGTDALSEVVQIPSIDVVLTALVGFSGLVPTFNAIKAKKAIALANKETLVVAGELITKLAKQNDVDILPVDSEHSAIFQCLMGERSESVEKLILTASGGPFRGKNRDYLRNVSFRDALKHPNWTMGQKITIDSASLMNKGLEVIEAHWLFGVEACQIDVVVHPQSIIHSMVQFSDGSIKDQLGLPDMKLPIQYALAYPERVENKLLRLDFNTLSQLTFEKPDMDTFSNLRLAYQALEKGGTMPCVLNAANEIVVAAFLNQEIGFLQMSELIEETMVKIDHEKNPDLETFSEIDHQSRAYTKEAIKKQRH